jgi:phosphate transport system ATP-binding protein
VTHKLEARRLCVSYGQKRALHGIDVAIARNEVLALIGPSGCGKSTFLRALNRMNERIPGFWQEGQVLLDGSDIYARGVDTAEVRRRIGMVFQRPNPFPTSVARNVAYGLEVAGTKTRAEINGIVERSLRHAALWDEVKDALHGSALALSAGQQQRLCIARALATGPEVLLMDEPASSLDPISAGKIEELVQELKSSVTIVVVTHNLQQAARISDRTAFFLDGNLVEVGPTSAIFTSPMNRKTEDYVTGRFG